MMDDTCKFYESKLRIFWLLLACIFLLFGCFLATESAVSYERFIGYSGLIFFGLSLIVAIFKIFNNKEYVEITPNYIKIGKFEKLLWTDITGVNHVEIHKSRFLYFEVKDDSKYRLTFWQKVNRMFGFSPFYISLVVLSAEDLQKLQSMISFHLHQNGVFSELTTDYQK